MATCYPGFFQVEYPEIDYKKYLGPDWKPSTKGPTAVVCNHQSWWDILVNMCFQNPSHVAKQGTLNIPMIGPIAEMCDCLFLSRDAGKA